jgi:hypothetical protein
VVPGRLGIELLGEGVELGVGLLERALGARAERRVVALVAVRLFPDGST